MFNCVWNPKVRPFSKSSLAVPPYFTVCFIHYFKKQNEISVFVLMFFDVVVFNFSLCCVFGSGDVLFMVFSSLVILLVNF